MNNLSWQAVLIGACAVAFMACVLIIFWPARRNRRTGLGPPSDACKRRGPEAVP